jgi:F0F1-type ATP synthase assembly protein I
LKEEDKVKWDVVLAMMSSLAGVLIGIGFQGYLDYMQIAPWARMVEMPIGLAMFIGVFWIIRKHGAMKD